MNYVSVTATNIKDPRDGDSNIGGGTGGSVTYWLTWSANGFTGNGWFISEVPPLSEWWGNNYKRLGYDQPTEANFIDYITINNPDNLDDVLGGWNNTQKFAFLITHSVFGYDDATGTFASACVELR